MARSARSLVAGVNIQLPNGALDSDLYLSNSLVYDTVAAYLPELRGRVPDCRITLRLINNSRWDDPEATAWAGADLVKRYPQVDYLCPGNELEYEHKVTSAAVAAWCQRFAAEWARQGWPRPIVTPAVSTGYPFDLGALQGAWMAWDAIGVHCYATLEDLAFTAAKGHLAAHRSLWPDHPLHITESDIEKLEETTYRHAEGAAAYEQWLDYVAGLGYVAELSYFLQDSHDQPYRLVRIPPLLDLHRRVGHETGGNPGPEPPNPNPEPPDPEIAAIEAKYNMSHVDGAEFYLAELTERPDPPSITAYGPADAQVLVSTKDNQHQGRGMGYAEVAFSHPAAYYPTVGQTGFYYSTCGDARVEGQGWALGIPGDTASHRNVVAHFSRRSSPPQPQPPSGHVWGGDFARFAAEHPEVGQPVGPLAYLPQDTEPWPCCAQVSATAVLVWNGFSTFAIHR